MGLTIVSAPSADKGVPITDVAAGGQAERIGLKAGQFILAINGQDVRGFSQPEAGAALTAAETVELQCDSAVMPAKAKAPVYDTAGAQTPTPESIPRVAANVGTLTRADGATLGLTIVSAPSVDKGVPITGERYACPTRPI